MTIVNYSPGQQAALQLVILPCALVSFLLFRYGKRRLIGKDTFGERMQYFYACLAGGTLGQFLFHTFSKSTGQMGSSFSKIFIFLGLYIMFCIQKCSRVSNENQHYTSPEAVSADIEHIINGKGDEMEMNDYYEASQLDKESEDGSTYFARDMWILMDENKELRKRRIFSILFYLVLSFISVLEGFFLVYNKNTVLGGLDVLVLMFYVHKIMQTFIVSTTLLHGMFHVKHEHKIRWYIYLSALWCLNCSLSSLPAMLNISFAMSAIVLTHSATLLFYAIAGGVLFWIAIYFLWIDRKRTDKRETNIRLFLFGLFTVVSLITSFFI